MRIAGTVNKGMEWLEHGKTLVEVILALGGGKVVKALLTQFTRTPEIWITPIWLLSSAVFLWLLMTFWKAQIGGVQRQLDVAAQPVASALKPVSPFDVDTFFRESYIGQLQPEAEANIRALIQSRPPDMRDEFVIRFIATGLVNMIYEQTWLTIYRSQVLALIVLNQRLLRREQLQPYYDEAARMWPDRYGSYSFDQWLNYMKGQFLILEHPGQTFEITVRGKDFLKFMVHHGYTADNRKY